MFKKNYHCRSPIPRIFETVIIRKTPENCKLIFLLNWFCSFNSCIFCVQGWSVLRILTFLTNFFLEIFWGNEREIGWIYEIEEGKGRNCPTFYSLIVFCSDRSFLFDRWVWIDPVPPPRIRNSRRFFSTTQSWKLDWQVKKKVWEIKNYRKCCKKLSFAVKSIHENRLIFNTIYCQATNVQDAKHKDLIFRFFTKITRKLQTFWTDNWILWKFTENSEFIYLGVIWRAKIRSFEFYCPKVSIKKKKVVGKSCQFLIFFWFLETFFLILWTIFV